MTTSAGPIVIVGGGAAAASAAYGLRNGGYEDKVLVFSAEDHIPYERPPLSKTFLSGQDAKSLPVLEDDWYQSNAVELVRSRVTSLDPSTNSIETETGVVGYSSLLLVMGGMPRRLPGDPPGVRYVRTVEDARSLRDVLDPSSALVVIGGGFLGCEIAATASEMGVSVTLLEMLPRLMSPLPAEISYVMQTSLERHGVVVRTKTPIEQIEEGVVRSGEESFDADVVVAALGIEPSDALAGRAGVATRDGILVDEECRTGVPNIFSAGDVARAAHPAYSEPVRVEHHDNALQQAAIAARAMLGDEASYTAPFWFWSDQLGVNLQQAGRTDDFDDRVMRGDLDALDCTVFYLKEGLLRGVVTLDRPSEMRAGLRLLRRGLTVDLERLEHDDLRQLLKDTA